MTNLVDLNEKRKERETFKAKVLRLVSDVSSGYSDVIPLVLKMGEVKTIHGSIVSIPENVWEEGAEDKERTLAESQELLDYTTKVLKDALKYVSGKENELFDLCEGVDKEEEEVEPDSGYVRADSSLAYNEEEVDIVKYYYLVWSTAMVREELSEESLKALREELQETLNMLSEKKGKDND